MNTAVAAKLDSVCWDLRRSSALYSSHRIHPYPAKFIKEIPKHLIELFHPSDCSTILDPFCGSGTTLVEAKHAGVNSVGIDLHPLATLIAKVKTTFINANLVKIGESIISAAKERIAKQSVSIPVIPSLDHWFQKHIQTILAALIPEIELVQDQNVSDALKVAFSSIVVRVSNQDSDTRYAAVKKNITEDDVWNFFQRAVSNINSAVTVTALTNGKSEPNVKILNKDLMEVEPSEVGSDVGLVITSPPYPNAYEYWLYHKYRMYWLGMNPIEVRKREIGSRSHYFKKNHQTEKDFERQMARCFNLLSQVMIPNAYACFVIGRSIIHGRQIDNESLLERAAQAHGFRKVGSTSRNIALNRKSFNLSHGKINKEGIMVFLREGK